jgi:hypothetical protein
MYRDRQGTEQIVKRQMSLHVWRVQIDLNLRLRHYPLID